MITAGQEDGFLYVTGVQGMKASQMGTMPKGWKLVYDATFKSAFIRGR